MKYGFATSLVFAAACASSFAVAAPRPAHPAQHATPQARITMAQARAIALQARPGNITDAELEREGGGSGLRYSFDIKADGKTYEVGVDANSGAVLENKVEGRNPD
jgi:uncharacterized membrane protein YkoI